MAAQQHVLCFPLELEVYGRGKRTKIAVKRMKRGISPVTTSVRLFRYFLISPIGAEWRVMYSSAGNERAKDDEESLNSLF